MTEELMRQKSMINYFLNGFSLINRSLDIFLISLLLSLPTLLSIYTQNSFFVKVLQLLGFILFFISTGFMVSLPVFLIQKQQKRALDHRQIVGVTLKNTKRIILPGILLFIFFTILLGLSIVLVVIFLHPSKDQVTIFFQNFGKGWQPIFLIPITLIAFLEFTSFFFSLEHNGLLSSIKKSIVAAFNNLHYTSIVILISIISYSLTGFIPIDTFWGQLARMVLGGYIALVVTASSLFYYQNIIKRAL